MPQSFDVVVVGARCAGAPLAMSLARAGLSVCLVDRSRFPSEVPSTHAIQPNGVAALDRLGLLDRVRSTGAPPIVQAKIDIDGVVMDYTDGSGFLGSAANPMFCVRRSTLDILLAEAATRAGADFRPGTTVTGLVAEGGRAVGVETSGGPIRASLVVGADGPHSAVARLAGAREYHVTPPGRMFMWGYFEGVTAAPPRIWLGKCEDTGLLAAPTDGDLFLVAVVPSQTDRVRCLSDTSAALTQGLRSFPEVADVVSRADLALPVRTMTRWHGYFREATGPGWVLVGDAGHFKDPTPGQGIADAFRQVEHLVPVITGGLEHGTLDARLRDWSSWRDRDAWDMYWFAGDMGAPGPTTPLVREMIRQICERAGGPDRFLKVLDHELAPSALFNPQRALAAAFALLRTRTSPRRAVARDLRRVVGREVVRQRRRRRPLYVTQSDTKDSEPASLAGSGASRRPE